MFSGAGVSSTACFHALHLERTLLLSATLSCAAGNKDKKLAALDIVNVSIKIYFRLNTLRLCKNLIRTVDSRQVHKPFLLGCLLGTPLPHSNPWLAPGATACAHPCAAVGWRPEHICPLCSLPTLTHSLRPSV